MLAPIVLFVYNRLDHTQGVIETLLKNTLAKESEFYIFSDAAKTENGVEKVNEVRKFIQDNSWHTGFKKVSIVEAEKNKGLAKSIIGGVSDIIQKYGKVIVLEDDLKLSPYFLEYMNDALEYYREDEKIWSISGYSFPMKSLKRYPHDIFYSYRGCSWGWATWIDRWKTVDWQVKEYEQFIGDQKWIERLNRGGVDLTNMLKMQMDGKIDSWAIRWCFSQSNQEMYTVYPRISYLENAGCDGSGIHSSVYDEYYTDMSQCVPKCRFETLEIDKKIAKEFQMKYKDTIKKKIRRRIQKIFK